VGNAVTHPVDTVEGVPKGVGRFFQGVGKSAKKAGSDVADAASGDDEGEKTDATPARKSASKAKRQIAKKFKVDPYSDNDGLQKKLDDLALATTAGGFALTVVNPVAIVSTVATVNNLVWDTPAPDLQVLNGKKLAASGVSEKTRKDFFENRFFTPTEQTALVAAFGTFKGLEGIDDAVELVARRARSQDDARFFRRAAELLACYAKRRGPLASLSARENLFVAQAGSGALVVPAPVDLLIWTPVVESVSGAPSSSSARELWLSGRASEAARAKLQALGWTLKEKVAVAGCR
jgi:hypothetical protein